MSSQPPPSVTAGVGFGLTVTIEDSFNNVVTDYGGRVTIALLNNPGGAGLGGTLTVTPVDGVASFSGLTLNKSGTGYTLEATAGQLTSAATSAVTVVPAAAAQLAITSQPPSSVAAGAGFGLTVTAEDAFGNAVTDYSGSVTIALLDNPGGSDLVGTLTVTAVDGAASFAGLVLDTAATGYTIEATANNLTASTTTRL